MRGRHHPLRHPRPPWQGGTPFNRLGCYFRAHLHRRIFAWFGLTILLTAIVVGVAAAAMSPFSEYSWKQEVARAEAFVGHQFAQVWDDPARRDALAQQAARDLAIDLTLLDGEGRVLSAIGAPCRARAFSAPVIRDEVRLGSVRVCSPRRGAPGPWRFIAGLVLAGAVIWAASGKIARRLSRPLVELSRVAGELGNGNLEARAQLGPHADGEARLLGAAINEMADRIQKQIADQRELLAAVSHELRTPLGHLRLLAELARGGGADPRTLDEIDREVVEIDALVGQLLANSKLDFKTLSLSAVDPVDAARRALDRAGLAPELLEIEGTPPIVQADPTLISRALANLLDNARKHAGGATALRVRANPGTVSFEVHDAGPGMAPGDEERVFDPFFRSSQQQPRDRESVSLGLGLALVKRIAVAHRGVAYARNNSGPGAIVGFQISA